MGNEENINVVKQFVADVWNNQDVAMAKELLSPDYRVTFYGMPQMGYDDYFEHFPRQLEAWPDVNVTIEQIFGQDDWVAVRYMWTATHSQPAFGIPPSGKKVTGRGIATYRVADGKVVEGWTCEDMLTTLRTMGAIPSPG